MNEYGIKRTINHEAHKGYEGNTKLINVLNLHALHMLHGYLFYIEYFYSLSRVETSETPYCGQVFWV